MIRIGTGYDCHRLVEGRELILGGVSISFSKGLQGHSDADVLAHAIIDALLGAAALGNIGQLYPDTDPQYKDADSMALLADTVKRIREAGYTIANIDANILAEAPKLNPHIQEMRVSLAKCLNIGISRVSVKAKTNEKLGPEGKGEAMSCQAVVLIKTSE